MTRYGACAHQLEIVRRHHHRRAAGVDVAQQLEDAARGALVEIAGGLVGEQHDGVVHQRARDRHALLLAARQLARERRRLGGEPDLRQHAAHPRGDGRAARAGDLERERDVLLGSAVLEQAKVLEHDAEAAPQVRHVARARSRRR